jgi:hypothetical protein
LLAPSPPAVPSSNVLQNLGAKFQLLIEPKPREPTKHQYDYDAQTVIGFLKHYGLDKDFKLNIEPNHTTLAGHSYEHDLIMSSKFGYLGSIDANTGTENVGWDTDQFPMDVKKAIFERRELRVDHLVVCRPRVECIAVCGMNVTASFESMNARLEDAEFHDGVFLLKIDALEEVRVLSTLSHRELENTRVDVVLDGIEQVSMTVKFGVIVAPQPQFDEDFFHAARLSLNVGDLLVRALEGFLRAFEGVDYVLYVRFKVVHLVRGRAELFTELFHDDEALGERLQLDCRDT